MLHPESITIHNAVVVDAAGDPRWAFPLHTHERDLEISLVQTGAGTFYCDGHSYPMKQGDVIVKNAGTIHAEQTGPDAALRQVCLSFSGVDEIDGCPGHLLPRYACPVLHSEKDFGVLSAAFDYLAAHWQDEASGAVCSHLTQAALGIIQDLIPARPEERAKTKRGDSAAETVARVADWLNGHYMQKITLSNLADQFYISPYYLDRKFKSIVGYSISQYVIDRRMGEAQRQLIFENASIKEIALAVGYENLQYFYATFKKSTGVTPQTFRERFQPS